MCSTFYEGLFPDPGREDYNAGCSDSQPVSTFFIFKEFATDDSNVSFERCRVEVVACLRSQMQTWFYVYAARYATQCVKRQYNSL